MVFAIKQYCCDIRQLLKNIITITIIIIKNFYYDEKYRFIYLYNIYKIEVLWDKIRDFDNFCKSS